MADDQSGLNVRTIGARIRRECIQRGWDVSELPEKAGVSRTTLYHLERGHTQRVRPSTINAIATALGVPVDLFLDSEESDDRAIALTDAESKRFPEGASAFDRMTNPAVADVARERPEMFVGWSDDEWDELYSQFGVGGALTTLGVLSAAEAINEKRETIRQLHVVMDTHLRDVAREVIETFYRMVRAGESPSRTESRPSANLPSV